MTVRSAFAGKRQVVEFYGNELSRLRFPMKDDESGETKEVNMEVLLAKMTSSKDTKTRRECTTPGFFLGHICTLVEKHDLKHVSALFYKSMSNRKALWLI